MEPTRARPLHAMFVHAHPDDESSKGAGTMARYANEGYRISVVTCTDGGRGDILNPAMDRPGVRERMVDIRRSELARALEILGVGEHHDLGYPDSGWVDGFTGDGSALEPDCFFNVPVEAATARLAAIIRGSRPDVLVTYPEDGGYPHPDHIRTHDISVAAVAAAADPAHAPGDGAPWQVAKTYYTASFSPRRVEALHAACAERGLESPFARWMDDWDPPEQDPVTTQVEVADFVAHRSQALLAHATQIDPEGMWFWIPDEVVAEVYPWEDYTLAASTVATELPERSLFAGLE